MNLKKITLLFILLITGISINATNYYIDSINGNDGNSGLSATNAFKSLFKIDRLNLEPGDTVYFLEGTYTRSNSTLLTISQSGQEGKYITFQNYNKANVILEFDSWTGIDIINGASYIKIKGVKIKGARSRINLEDALSQPGSCDNDLEGSANGFYNGTGILAVGPNLLWSNPATRGDEIPHHIIVEDCEIFDCTSSGMAFQQADYVTIINNKIYNNCWYSLFGTSGINLYQFINTDGTLGFHNTISNNLMYGNEMRVPQVPFCAFFDGNAFIIDDFKHTQTKNYLDKSITFDAYTAKTLISNNVSVENGGSGLHFFLSSNCYIYNNTIVNNASQNEGANGNGDLRIGVCDDFEVKNNIIIGKDRLHNIGGNTNINYSHNLQNGPGILTSFKGCEGCIDNSIPQFITTDVNSTMPFVTEFESVVKDSGVALPEVVFDFLGTDRFQDEAYDIGAYELLACYPTVWFEDIDNDGLGDANNTVLACDQPLGYVNSAGDECPDDFNKIAPGICGCGNEEDSCDTICNSPEFSINITYSSPGIIVSYQGKAYENKWYTKGDLPTNGGPWKLIRICKGETVDCVTISDWSAGAIYSIPGTQVKFENAVYENKWYVTGEAPGTGNAWELMGVCAVSSSSFLAINAIAKAEGSDVSINQTLVNRSFKVEVGDTYKLQVFNLSGTLIETRMITSKNKVINTEQLKQGVHVLIFTNTTNQQKETKRIVKL
ncbi:right-handed parallel beta-helix repeat-containing protein [Aquimarina agarivorans]|uniref:right-handed parallel beta-helix repeat-containing protein n=1 Tax=Aquimarina agarivorans TaxID=980584 RepID=UPI000248F8C5|nr:right-handed parallel beta-helix repeat-containing protein [Aquimarina agarivorans]